MSQPQVNLGIGIENCYKLSLQYHKVCQSLEVPDEFRNHLHGASSSLAIYVAEAMALPAFPQRRRHLLYALEALRDSLAAITPWSEIPFEVNALAGMIKQSLAQVGRFNV